MGMNICTWEWSFVPGNEDLYLGMNICTWEWRFVPGNEDLYLGMKICTWEWRYVPRCSVSYLGMNLVRNRESNLAQQDDVKLEPIVRFTKGFPSLPIFWLVTKIAWQIFFNHVSISISELLDFNVSPSSDSIFKTFFRYVKAKNLSVLLTSQRLMLLF
jgi:hypothetical protein